MAEAFLKKYAGDYFDVYSAGFDPKPIHPYAIKVMQEIGYDISNQQPKELRQLTRDKFFAVAITVCKKAEEEGCPTILGAATRLSWNLDDPANFEGTEEEKLAKFREVRDQIHEQVKSFLKEKQIII
jgi:arsenate reductase